MQFVVCCYQLRMTGFTLRKPLLCTRKLLLKLLLSHGRVGKGAFLRIDLSRQFRAHCLVLFLLMAQLRDRFLLHDNGMPEFFALLLIALGKRLQTGKRFRPLFKLLRQHTNRGLELDRFLANLISEAE